MAQKWSEIRGTVRARRTQPAHGASTRCGGAPAVSGRPLPAMNDEGVLEFRMPVTFTAFCTLYLAAYLRFATVCTRCPCAGGELVQEALGDLAAVWEEAMRSASPAALAWDLISKRCSARARSGHGGSAYRVMPRLHADAVILRYRLGLGLAETAELMGVDEMEVNGMLRYAMRWVTEARHMRAA